MLEIFNWIGEKSRFTRLIIESILVRSHGPKSQRSFDREFMLNKSKKIMFKADFKKQRNAPEDSRNV